MRALSDMIFENKSLMVLAAAIALLVAAILVLLIFRLAFGRRLHMPGNGRARAPRLGIVDAFDLDRQRQLVIVRRDNVEHLIMIGGPNDLVIESEIIRAETRDVRVRDKEPRETAQAQAAVAWPPEFDASRAVPAASLPQRKTQPPLVFPPEPESEPRGAGPDEPFPPPTPAFVAPPPRPPVFPLPPRRSASPIAAQPQRTQVQREPGANPSSVFPRAPLATPFLRPPPPRQFQNTKPPSALPPEVEQPPSALEAAAASATSGPAPATDEFKSAPPDVHSQLERAPSEEAAAFSAQDPIDTLEEEMAKLLGRGPGK